ncbi:DNA repair protein rad2 [Marasmius crinis-equi]|uniref:DNA repair protein rad2 n=1 Tax=Marasmius crinis-equi TaxID=585013 RepID=A0ABR3FIG4_9AGAR
MGVKSLWSLLTPVGRPVMLENMEGKTVAIDSSIWIYQFQATMRSKDGRVLLNAHVLGFLRRISKLLFFGMKPVFVFDGGAPALKRETLNERRRKKSGAAVTHAKVAEKLLAAQMRREALKHVKSGQSSKKGKEKATAAEEEVVFLEDLDSNMPTTPAKKKKENEPSSSTKKGKFYDHDPYRLPEVDMGAMVANATRSTAPDPRLATEDELRDFIEHMRPEDFDVTSAAFRELPTEVQYEIVGDLRLKSRQTSYTRLQQMLRHAPTPLDFSKQQIKNLQQRNALTQQLLTTTDTIGKAHIEIPVRIASERNREYVLLKNEDASGGWILGIRDEGTESKPILIDHDIKLVDTDEDDDMEEVDIPAQTQAAPAADPDLREYQRTMALSGIAARSAPKKLAPLTTKTVPAGPTIPLFTQDEEGPVHPPSNDWEEDEDLALAIQASIDHAQDVDKATAAPSSSSSRGVRRAPSPEINVANARRLETALSIANAGPLSNSFFSATSSSSLSPAPSGSFGQPFLLNMPNDALVPSASTIKQRTKIPAPETPPHTSPRVPDVEALPDPHHSPESSQATPVIPSFTPQSPLRTVADDSDGSDDDMEPVLLPRLSHHEQIMPVEDVPESTEQVIEFTPPADDAPEAQVSRAPSPQSPVAPQDAQDDVEEQEEAPSTVDLLEDPEDDLEASDPPETYNAVPEGSRPPTPDAEDWDAAQEMDPAAEEGEFARFVSQVKGRDIDDVRREIDEEITSLNEQRKNAMRDSEDITQQMITQIMIMLRLFGIPYITAPMEAEAQCAALVSLGLVDGIITDDSDVFLFGGERVYKNMFNQSKTVECFLSSDLTRELGLDQGTLIRLAYLLGSDYVEGLPGVGPVVAMELMREFPGDDGLHKFKDWWTKVQTGRDQDKDNKSTFRKRFLALMWSYVPVQKKKFKNLYLPPDWPNSAVRDAYFHPTVDESEEPFKWGLPDLDALREFLKEELGWNQSKVDDLLLPIIQKMNKRSQTAALNRQGNLNEFFDVSGGSGTLAPRKRQAYASKRLQAVVSDFRKKRKNATSTPASASDEDSEVEEEHDSGSPPPTKKTKTSNTTSRKGKQKATGEKTQGSNSRGKPRGPGTKGRRGRKTAASATPSVGDESGAGDELVELTAEATADPEPLAVNLRPRPKPKPAYRTAQIEESAD